MATAKSVFIIGPGFIGRNVLDLLVAEGYHVSGLVRREEHGKQIRKSGAVPILGDLDDRDLVIKHVLENDITIHTAMADHLASVLAVLEGVSQRADSGKETIYIHTTSTSVLCSTFTSTHEFRDTKPQAINEIGEGAMHRHIDLAIIHAREAISEKAKIAIMLPPAIYGVNPKHNKLSIQIPTLTRFALKHGWAGYVGDSNGSGLWSCIHVLDLARGYITLLDHMLASPPLKNPYFFCENGTEFTWREAAERIGKALKEKGLIEEEVPRSIRPKYYESLFGEWTDAVLGMNSRSRAVRLRKLGWESREKEIWESFEEDELPLLLNEMEGEKDKGTDEVGEE
jgi:nucleoside-diphosphate-sugar epimerase